MKNYLVQVTTLVLFLTNLCLLVSHAQSVQFSPEETGEGFRNLIIARSHLLLGSSNAIYRLDNSLTKQDKRSLTAPNRMLVTDYVGSFTDNVLSCSSDSCFLAQITDFTNVSWQVDPPFIRPGVTDNVAGVFAPRANGTSDLTYGERAGGQGVGGRLLAKGSLFNVGTSDGAQSFNTYARRREGSNFDPLVYLTEFPLRFLANDSGYVYFVVHPIQGETRLVRFCEDDPGLLLPAFVSHFEIVLECGMENDRAPSTGATFLNITSAFNDRPTIVLSRNRILGTNSIQLEVCSFDIGTINSLMTQKYDNCVIQVDNAMSGFLRDGQMVCGVVSQPSRVSECFLPGTARPGLEVQSPYTQQPLISLPLNSATTSMVHTVLDETLYLFVATTNGSLLQFHIANPTTSTYVRTIQLPLMSVENVTKMVTSDNGEYVFALTPSTLVRHQVDMCDTLTSCSECVTSDPICGWCAPTGTCTRRSNCPNVAPVATPIWIEEASSCPSIDSITPPIVYIPELSNTITFTLTTSNIASTLLTMYSYNCQFRFRNANGIMISDRMATQTNGVFTCTAPPSDHIPQLATGQDTLETMISLTVRGTDVSIAELNMTFPFTDCAVHESCTSCIGASRCEWCPFSFQCIQPGTGCSNTEELTVSNGGVCPQIFPSSSTGEYLIHANYDYQQSPLRINSSNLTRFRNDFNNDIFRCQICSQNDLSCTSPLFSLPASLAPSGNEVLCEQTRFDSTDSTPTISARLRVIWNNQRTIDNPDNASVILYSCSLMGTNCGQCLAQESRFECSYCVEGPAPPSMTGNCQLGASCSGNGFLRFDNPQDVPNCPSPSISDFEPKAGPTRGGTMVTINGTNLGARREDIVRVMIDGVNCNVSDYAPGVSITCTTGEKEGSVISDKVSIYFTHLPDTTIRSAESFTFVTPFLNSPPASPERGPRSGGTNITIMGRDIGTGSTHRVLVSSRECEITEVMLNSINCTTPPGDAVTEVGTKELVEVFVDNWSFQLAGFQYVADPTFGSINPDFTFVVGGINYTISGENLDSVQEPRLLIYYDGVPSGGRKRRQIMQEGRFISEPCIVESPVRMYCTAPSLSSEFNQSSRPLRIGLLLDGVTSLLELNNSLNLFPDPVFTRFEEERVFTSGNPIPLTIEGEGFVFTTGQVNVLIEPCQAEVCQCTVMNIFPNNTLTCEIDILSQQDLEGSRPLMIIVAIGNFMQEIGTIQIQDQSQLEILYYLVPVVAIVFIFVGVVLMVIVTVFCRKARQKDRKYDQLILELEKLESSVARECKLGFAELQTDLDELTGDVVGCRLPYRDLQSYLLTTLFPGAKTHPVLHQLQIPHHQRPLIERGLKDFSNLLLDKRTLLIFIRSMEEQRGFTIRDKSIVGSLLIVALSSKLDYATDVLKSLLSELIRRTVQTSPKLLLRRTESVAEKMLTNWLAFCLHGYVMEHVGQPMYLLYRAVKNQLEKGPIDVITGEARYSLSEQKLIRQKVDVVVLDATVEMEDGLRIPVKLLDCDTISQVKEKMLDAVYKAAPVSQRPTLTKVDLEYIKSSNERAILRDEDASTVVEGGWKKINTLKHYWVKEGAIFRLIQRRDYAPPGRAYDYPGSLISSHTPRQRALSEAEDGTRVWHLFKQLDMEDPKRSPFMNKKLVSEIYLPRMLSTKSILQKFADDLFHSLFSISHPPSSPTATYNAVFPNSPGVQVPMGYAPGADAVPMAVKYLFDFLDDEAEAIKILDPDVVHTWKNNALSLRFWVNLIKNPEFVFDINKSHTVDACLSVIAQAFIDGCSSSEMKLTIDSPTSKLLYNKEVQGYKAEVKKYYDNVKNLPRIPEDAMQYYLRQLSTYQFQQMRKTGGAGFVVESALQDLLRYADKYHEPFLQNLRAAGLESKAQLFEGVLKVFSN